MACFFLAPRFTTVSLDVAVTVMDAIVGIREQEYLSNPVSSTFLSKQRNDKPLTQPTNLDN